jgi:hypothetical protein
MKSGDDKFWAAVIQTIQIKKINNTMEINFSKTFVVIY